MMKRYFRRRSASHFKTLLYGSLLVLMLSGLAYATFRSYGQLTPDAYGCFAGVEQPATFVLVDASEPRFNTEQARSLRTYFDKLYAALAFNERLSFVTSEADQIASIAAPRFHVCGQAKTPEQLEAIGAASAQVGYLKKQRERLYGKIVGPELDALLSEMPDKNRRQLYQSPIMEMIADISRLPDFKPGSRIIIVSDLIQNSDSVQFCRVQNDMPPFHVFKERPVYARLKPKSLQGIEVEILMIQRWGYGQAGLEYCADEDELMAFWRDYLTDNGAQVNVIRIRNGLIAG
jgi:hypothetical protein